MRTIGSWEHKVGATLFAHEKALPIRAENLAKHTLHDMQAGGVTGNEGTRFLSHQPRNVHIHMNTDVSNCTPLTKLNKEFRTLTAVT